MDEREKAEEQVEDLAVGEKDAEDVKGGSFHWKQGGITADDDWEAPVAAKPGQSGRGGWDGNHNETLVRV